MLCLLLHGMKLVFRYFISLVLFLYVVVVKWNEVMYPIFVGYICHILMYPIVMGAEEDKLVAWIDKGRNNFVTNLFRLSCRNMGQTRP